jgi:hypothetical protein
MHKSNPMSLRNLTVATTLVALTAVGGFWFSPAAHAAKTKDCGTTSSTTTSPVTPPNGNAGFTQSTTTTSDIKQTSACNSNSDTGQVITPISTITSPVTNKAGKAPGGHN